MDDPLKALRDAAGSGQSAENPLAGLLGGIFGAAPKEEGDEPDSVGDVASQAGITPDITQAVMALVAGQFAARSAGGGNDAKSAGFDELLAQVQGGQKVDETALKASGLPQNLAQSTGLDLSEAIRVLQKLLPSLAAFLGLLGTKPAQKPRPAAKPKPATKPRPAAKPKPKPSATSRPKPSGNTAKPAAKPKPKPKPSTATRPKPSTGTAKPTAKPRPRKSDESDTEGQ